MPVATLWLEEQNRVGRLDGLLNHPVGVVRCARADHAQAGGVCEVCLWALAVVLDRADAAAVWNTDNHGHCRETLATVLQPCELAGDLVKGRKDETVKLNFGYGTVAAHR